VYALSPTINPTTAACTTSPIFVILPFIFPQLTAEFVCWIRLASAKAIVSYSLYLLVIEFLATYTLFNKPSLKPDKKKIIVSLIALGNDSLR